MSKMDRLLELIQHHRTPFLIERNYFLREGLHFIDELNALISDGHISQQLAIECERTGDIWYAEFYPNDRDGRYEVFASSYGQLVDTLVRDIEGYINACAH